MKFDIPKAVVIGTSAGGLAALSVILPSLVKDFPVPVMVVQHLGPGVDSFLVEYLNRSCSLMVHEGVDKMAIRNGNIYIAPPGYHMLVEDATTLALSVDSPVNYSRPSIDVLFESAARVWGRSLIGIVLTGANSDGARGLAKIKIRGGLTLVQDPQEAECSIMPRAAIASTDVDEILLLDKIGIFLNTLMLDT